MLILLDIDGVMVPAKSWKSPEISKDGFLAFNKNAVESLNKILNKTNAEITLITSHRSSYSLNQWVSIFNSRGINTLKIQRIQKYNPNKRLTRKDEVLNWLQSNPLNLNKRFVIIDDDKSLNDLPPELKEKLIQPSQYIGLNNDLAEKAIQILNRKKKRA